MYKIISTINLCKKLKEKYRIIRDQKKASPKAAPGTVREVTVATDMRYTSEVASSMSSVIPKTSVRTKHYEYRLELNADDEIIGGEWYRNT